TKLIPLATALYDAEERYRLANGDYTTDLESLDISLPPNPISCTRTATRAHCTYDWGRAGVTDGPTNVHVLLAGNRIAYMRFFKPLASISAQKGDIFCFAKPDDNIANKTCRSLGGTYVTSGSTWIYYRL
ncbi:MAG: hypothetical protein LBM71_05345, partial [Elusimicrobiota bacterium]|nr:hypothetical protein [Elusimicrobiota bacterium]